MSGLRIAIVKPEWGIRGGFELVIDRLVPHLTAGGHDVTVLAVDARPRRRRPFGVAISDDVWARAPEFFSYAVEYDECRRLITRAADLLITTQPPSFAAEHERHLAIFYHHRRLFYDLSSYALAAGMVGDADVHHSASEAVRALDDAALGQVGQVLAGSESVRDRLAAYTGRTRGVSLFHAGPVIEPLDGQAIGREPLALCLSRHDFPKRTELFVHAAHLLRGVEAIAVGAGGRLGFVQQLDERLADQGAPDEIDARELWLNVVPWIEPRTDGRPAGAVTFRSNLDTAEVSALMSRACCLVAPALLEDYGLTAIEAMRHGLPVVTCRDSGHLVEFVEHGVNGLVVEPDGRAIATAVQSLADDPRWARELGLAARDRSADYTWARALSEFDRGLELALS